MNLKDRVVVITGAAGGAGRTVSHRLAQQGARLVLVGRKRDALEELGAEVNIGDHCLVLPVDLVEPSEVSAAADAVVVHFGSVDVLIHLVGGWTGGEAVVDVDPVALSNMLQQHAWTTFHVAQAFVPHLLDKGWGRFIIVSSPFASTPAAKGAPYAMGKAAQEALMLTLAQEFKGTSLTSNILLVKYIDLKNARKLDPSPKNAAWTSPEEIAEAVLYLCSDDSGQVNGARIPLYGTP